MTTAAASNHGGSVVGKILASHGIPCLYTLCGGHISPLLQGAQTHGIAVVDLRDERSATFAADAASRLTGLPGVVAVTAGPGVTNCVTAVKNAQLGQQPLIVLGGATATVLRGRGALQDIDQLSLMKPVTKWTGRASKVQDIEPLLRRAIDVAVDGVPGPVFLELPMDVLYPEHIVSEWYTKQSGVAKIKGWTGAVARRGLQTYLSYLFRAPNVSQYYYHWSSGGWWSGRRGEEEKETTTHRSIHQQEVVNDFGIDERDVDRVVRLLSNAERPMLVMGSQAVVNLNPNDARQLSKSVMQLGIPVFLGGGSRGLLGRRSAVQFRHRRSDAMKEADVVITAGFPFDFRMGYGSKIHRKAAIVSVNLDRTALTKNRRPTHAIRCHPGRFLQRLAFAMASTSTDATRLPPIRYVDWYETLRQREEARDTEIRAMGRAAAQEGSSIDDEEDATSPSASSSSLVHPIHFFQRVEEKMGSDAVIIVDGGDFVATASYVLRPRKPLSWLDPGVFGTLGIGGGFAVGAASTMICCRWMTEVVGNDAIDEDGGVNQKGEIWIFYGDGSSAYSLAEFDTFRRLGYSPIAVVGNDASWQQIARDQIKILGTDVGTALRRTDYHCVAEGYGGKGLLLTDPSKVDETLDEARRLALEEGHAVCINVHLATSDFREGSISV